MDMLKVRELFDKEQRIEVEYPGMRRDTLPQVVRFIRTAPRTSFILHANFDETNADQGIEEQVAYFLENNLRLDWKVYDYDQPPDFKERLKAHGFSIDEPSAVMVLDLEEAPLSLLEPLPESVRHLTHRSQLRDVIRVEELTWGRGFEWIMNVLGEQMEIPGYLSIYVDYAKDKPACTGWVFFHNHSQFASLWGGATVPRERGQGHYQRVLAARVQEAIGRGFRYMVIDASPASRPIVEKNGFQLLAYAYDCSYRPDLYPKPG